MQRIVSKPRENWSNILEQRGFGYHTVGGVKYWNEDAYYQITSAEQLGVERATTDLWSMCLDAVEYVIANNLYDKFAIPAAFIPMIVQSWNEDHPALYGRFDFCVKDGSVKMLEFNADTPTSLFEAGVIQWDWLTQTTTDKDQFNGIHDHLVWYWGELKPYLLEGLVHFTCVKNSLEDLTNVEYIRDCAIQAGLETKLILVDDIGWDGRQFVDLEDQPITNIFKLYPWEWIMKNSTFTDHVLQVGCKMFWIEPAWKSILSNKAILPILWKLFPNHPLLLASYFEDDKPVNMVNYVKKPILSREGQGIIIVKNNQTVVQTRGPYGGEGFIYQDLFELPEFDGNYPVVGSWVIGQQACGIGFREDHTLISGNTSRFVPHLIVDGKRSEEYITNPGEGQNVQTTVTQQITPLT